MSADKLRALDDFLFDRVYQPIVDIAAPFDVKARHLSAAAFLCAGSVQFLENPHEIGRLIPLSIFVVQAYASLYLRPPGLPYRVVFAPRLIHLTLVTALCVTVLSIGFLIFSMLAVSGIYFGDCQDKPPKRRWWKEIKRAIKALAWTPELMPANKREVVDA